MASKGFSVDPQALRDVSVQLKKLTDEVAAHPARDLDCPPSAFDHSGVAAATSAFAERLQRAVEALTKDAGEIARRLDETGGYYEEVDLQVKGILKRESYLESE